MKKLIDEYPPDDLVYMLEPTKNNHIKPSYDNIFGKTSGNIFTVGYYCTLENQNYEFENILLEELSSLKNYRIIYTGTPFNQKILDCIVKNKLSIEIIAFIFDDNTQVKLQKNINTFYKVNDSLLQEIKKLFPTSSSIQIIAGHLPIYLGLTKFISEDSMPKIEQCHYPYKIGPLNYCLFDNSNDYNVLFHAIDASTNCIPNLYKWSPRLFSFILNFNENTGFRNHMQKVFDFSVSSIYKYEIEKFKTHTDIGKIFTSPMHNFYGKYHNNHFNDCITTYGAI